jgi:hypothetical protein
MSKRTPLSLLKASEYARGARDAADLTTEYECVNSHPYRLSDCILGKMNLRDGKPRKNPRAGSQFWQGYALVLADIIRDYGECSLACNVMMGNGTTLKTFRRAGVDNYDMIELRKVVKRASPTNRKQLRGR